jgi:hypothetical protein
MDLGSPVALDYHDRAPFEFNGKIHRIHIAYNGKQGEKFRGSPDDDGSRLAKRRAQVRRE